MEAAPTIRIEVALPAAQVLEQLAHYGKDWHESRLPAEARGVGLGLRVQDTSVELQLYYRGSDVVWRGSVSQAGGGSLITLTAEPVRMGPIAWFLLILASGALAVGRAGLKGALVLVPLAFALILFLDRLWPGRARGQAPLCRAILLRATQVSS